MSNLRWILLFSGFAILFLLYFSGRSKSGGRGQSSNRRQPDQASEHDQLSEAALDYSDDQQGEHYPDQTVAQPHSIDHSLNQSLGSGHGSMQGGSAELQSHVAHPTAYTDGTQQDHYAMPGHRPGEVAQNYSPEEPQNEGYLPGGYNHADQQQYSAEPEGHLQYDPYGNPINNEQIADDYGMQHQPATSVPTPAGLRHGMPPIPSTVSSDNVSVRESFGAVDPEDLRRPAGNSEDFINSRDDIQQTLADNSSRQPRGHRSTISQKISSFADKLTGNRTPKPTRKTARSGATESTNDKIVLLHVMQPNNDVIDGQVVLDVLESRGYQFGELNIYHSMHEGNTLFSVAKVVEPGSFDMNDIGSFDTPGLALILRLPGPVEGDVAFEVLMSEAYVLADALGCRVLDSGRSTLSRQTVQHLRESILEYKHKQRVLGRPVT